MLGVPVHYCVVAIFFFFSTCSFRRCLECLATAPNACLKLELRLMTEKWEEAEIQTEEALQQKEAVDDGVGSEFRRSVLPKKTWA